VVTVVPAGIVKLAAKADGARQRLAALPNKTVRRPIRNEYMTPPAPPRPARFSAGYYENLTAPRTFAAERFLVAEQTCHTL
jgi:hypothetical protein